MMNYNQVYAASFFAIPLVRWFITQKTNAEIDKRNRAREQRAQALELPDLSLRRKVCMKDFFCMLTFYDQNLHNHVISLVSSHAKIGAK